MARKKRGRPDDDFVPERAEPGEGVEEALGIVTQIEELVEGFPERTQSRGAEFFEDVISKAKSVGETITRTNRVSERQLGALKGWLDGVKKWDHGDRED